MKTLKLDLENCYGIKKLNVDLDFSKGRAVAIYAPNGSMKTSFAQTFDDIAKGVESKDRIFPERKTIRTVTEEAGKAIPKESIVVVRPYDHEFGHTEKTSTLLVNSRLRNEYAGLLKDVEAAADVLIRALREQAKTKNKNIKGEISLSFTKTDDKFFVALARIRDEVFKQKGAPLADVPYDVVFDEKVVAFLRGNDVSAALHDYITQYNKLLGGSMYFKRGVFNYYNAGTIAKSLADNGFFEAQHTLNLNAEKKVETITTEKQLADLIEAEKAALLADPALRQRYAAIEKQINKNATLRDFHNYLQDHEELLASLGNISDFKEEVWKSYLKVHEQLFRDLLEKVEAAEKRKAEIEAVAEAERTQWESVIDIFNHRFFVPFTLTVKNRTAVILGQERMLSLGFTFNDGGDTRDVERNQLLQVLSQGEKKALYILNIIFEVEVRKKAKQETLFVIDDVADSFDYKNKYAIIEYLRDISDEDNFKQVILTHNFDFFRTSNGRFVPYSNCFMVSKSATELTLVKAVGIRNVFVNDWKSNFYKDSKKQIASIPFMRNIIEYTKGEKDAQYKKLTSLLHCKDDTETITLADLDTIFNSLFNETGESKDSNRPVVDVIREAAEGCLKADDGVNFENKIVLSIATRLAAERFMIDRINDKKFVSGIDERQTIKLFAKFKEKFSGEVDVIRTLQGVVLITPESIHLNSFMYEPILDMSDVRLKALYTDVLGLLTPPAVVAEKA